MVAPDNQPTFRVVGLFGNLMTNYMCYAVNGAFAYVELMHSADLFLA